MRHGQSGWSNYSDRNMKENFMELDGEEVLDKIRTIPVTEWNYKKTDPTMKYVGPMAQDFYAAFHLGGTDSLGINTISIDGVNMAGIKAHEKRTNELKTALTAMEDRTVALMQENKKLKEQLASLKDMSEQVAALRQLKVDMLEQLKLIKAKNAVEISSK